MSEFDINEGLLRQRRNLMLINIILFAINYIGITIKQAYFIGVLVKLENPNALITIIEISSIYFFIRYIQYYLKDEKALNYIKKLNNDNIEKRSYIKAKIAFCTDQLVTDYYLPPLLFLIVFSYHIEVNYYFFKQLPLYSIISLEVFLLIILYISIKRGDKRLGYS